MREGEHSVIVSAMPSVPRLISGETVLATPFFTVVKERFCHEEKGRTFDYYKLDRPDGVIVLALTTNGEIILVRQYRAALKQFTLELPCGALDPGDSPIQAAERELYEETGYRCTLDPIGIGRIMMNRVAAREHCFFGRNAVLDPNFVPQEEIEVRCFLPDTFRELVRSGGFEQLATLGVILLAGWEHGLREFGL